MLSDLIIRLQPRKNIPNITVRDKTHSTAICTTRMTKSLRSSWGTRDPPPSPVTTLFVLLLEYVSRAPARVWLPLKSASWVALKRETFMFPCGWSAGGHETLLDRHAVSPQNHEPKQNAASCDYSDDLYLKEEKNEERKNNALLRSRFTARRGVLLLLQCVNVHIHIVGLRRIRC